MRTPSTGPGARDRFDRLGNNSTYESSRAPRQNQAPRLDDDHPVLADPPAPWRALGPVGVEVVADLRLRLGASS